MGKNYKAVLPKIRELGLLSSGLALLGWDQEVMMPKGNNAYRGDQMAALASVGHHKLTDPTLGKLLKEAQVETDLNPYEQTNIRETLRAHEKALKIPAELIEELTRSASQANHVWVEARRKSDFPSFAPSLEKLAKISLKIAECIGYAKVPYDAMLDDYDPGSTVENTTEILNTVRNRLVPMVQALKESRQKPDRSILTRHYPEAAQRQVCRDIAEKIGFDFNCGRLDLSAHPFTSSTSPADVRLTTRYDEHWFPGAFYGVVHEAGHGMYEQGLNQDYIFTPAADAAWLSVHESQSRFWENIIGRSRAFCSYYFPVLQKNFPEALKEVSEEAFYGAVNFVEPSLIRVEADEVTYGLHVCLRYEIEQALFDSSLKVKDLPAAWNERMKNYFGIVPPNDAQGVLQDIHWAHGSFGYFPTYLKGTLYSAQWWQALKKDLPQAETLVREGDFAPIKEWLRKIHREGKRFWSQDLVKEVTGEALNPDYFFRYLKEKFEPLYAVRF